jgi:hypothetical protein
MAAVLRDNIIDREIEYAFEIKLLGLPPQASAFLVQIGLITRCGSRKAAQKTLIGVHEIQDFRHNQRRIVLPVDELACIAGSVLKFTSLRLSVLHLGRRRQ